jgi:hypothetical protein
MTWRTAIGLKVFFVGRPFGLLPSLGTASQAREPDSPSGLRPLLHPVANPASSNGSP